MSAVVPFRPPRAPVRSVSCVPCVTWVTWVTWVGIAAGAPASLPARAQAPAPAAAPANPWGGCDEAPPPSAPLPHPEAPREPGAAGQLLDVPPPPPEPARTPLDTGVPPASDDPRFATRRTRAELSSRGALDLDTALVDVPGLWLSHAQAGASTMLLRGLSERDLAVTLDDVPVFDLGGLLPVLEQFSPASLARLTLHHGPRALAPSSAGAAGVLAVDSLVGLTDEGEALRLDGALGGGTGGADLEKGVFIFAETGLRRVRAGVHATLLNREDQRLGRGFPTTAGLEPGGVLPRSGGSGGAVGARLDVVPRPGQHLFTTWHSSRAIDVPRPPGCAASDVFGRPLDCAMTRERGLDAWIVGGEQALEVLGARLVLRGRAHAQHAIARDERAGTGITVLETNLDEGVRAGGRASVEAALPTLLLVDAWRPRAVLSADLYADRFSSGFFSRSTRAVDAEPPGLGIEDPTKARLEDGSAAGFQALGVELRAEGSRATLWAAGQATSAGPTGELGMRGRLLEDFWASAAFVHRPGDDTVEAGAGYGQAGSWVEVEGVGWASARAGRPAVGVLERDVPARTASGLEARGALRPGLAGLSALGTFGLVAVDDGGLLDARTPASGVVNPAGTLVVAWDPTTLPGGFWLRTRAFFPQQRLSPVEERDREAADRFEPALCPERPSDEDLAAGVEQRFPCGGAPGAFLLDLGARLELGRVRVDAVAENLLDQQGALRDEPIGFGGTSVRVLLTIDL